MNKYITQTNKGKRIKLFNYGRWNKLVSAIHTCNNCNQVTNMHGNFCNICGNNIQEITKKQDLRGKVDKEGKAIQFAHQEHLEG